MTTTPIALGERAMLVNLSVSIWSARKHDIRISDKVAAEHGADRSMGRYAKHLIPRELLTAVNAANSALRDHHNLNTLAWGDDGTRILPAANYLGYQAAPADPGGQVRPRRAGFRRQLSRLCRDRAQSPQRPVRPARLPRARRRSPRNSRCAATSCRSPSPTISGCGSAMPRSPTSAPRSRPATPNWCQNANRDLWQRVHEVTTRLVDRLSAFEVDPIAGTRLHPFRDSLIENVRALLEIMPRLNLTDDAEIERVRQDLATKVACHDPEALREDRTLRAEVVDAASAILAQMEGYC